MSSIAIPKKLLIHSVDYYRYNCKNDWGGVGYDDAVRINDVRVDLTTVYSKDLTQNRIVAEGVVFVDLINSSPVPNFTEQSKLVFNGRDYVITKVIPCYNPTSNAIHHYELEMI